MNYQEIKFKFRNGFLYHISGGYGKKRLCIPKTFERKVFEQAHDQSSHGSFHRIYDRIISFCFIRHFSNKLKIYVRHCPKCQINQTLRHQPFGFFVPIKTLFIPFHIITLDFVLKLPETVESFNCMLTITDKFIKRVLFIPGKNIYDATNLVNLIIADFIFHGWGILKSIVNDKDSKFMSFFWRAIFRKLGVSFLTFTVYHPKMDGQSERTNQTMEIGLRFFLTENPDQDWSQFFSPQGSHNNAISANT